MGADLPVGAIGGKPGALEETSPPNVKKKLTFFFNIIYFFLIFLEPFEKYSKKCNQNRSKKIVSSYFYFFCLRFRWFQEKKFLKKKIPLFCIYSFYKFFSFWRNISQVPETGAEKFVQKTMRKSAENCFCIRFRSLLIFSDRKPNLATFEGVERGGGGRLWVVLHVVK